MWERDASANNNYFIDYLQVIAVFDTLIFGAFLTQKSCTKNAPTPFLRTSMGGFLAHPKRGNTRKEGTPEKISL